jgi:hypothetical protein
MNTNYQEPIAISSEKRKPITPVLESVHSISPATEVTSLVEEELLFPTTNIENT